MANNAADAYINRLSETFDHDIKGTFAGMTIIDLGTITRTCSDGTVDVQLLGAVNNDFPVLNAVEVIYPCGLGMAHVNDIVLVLIPKTTFQSLDNNIMDVASGFYGLSGAKVIPIQISSQMSVFSGIDNNGNFTVSGNGASFTVNPNFVEISYGGNMLRYNSDGTTDQVSSSGLIDTGNIEGTLQYTIYNDDGLPIFSFTIDPTGKISLDINELASRICEINIGNNRISVTDNDDDGKHIIIQDANRDPDDEEDHGNIVVLNEDGIEAIDINENTVTMNSDGINVTDTNGNNATLDSSGISITDCNNNELTMSSSGIVEQTNSSTLLEIGNSAATLGKLLQDLATNVLLPAGTVGSPGAHTMNPATISAIQQWAAQAAQVFSS